MIIIVVYFDVKKIFVQIILKSSKDSRLTFLMLTGQCMVNVREAIKIVAWSTVEKFNFIQSSNAPLIS